MIILKIKAVVMNQNYKVFQLMNYFVSNYNYISFNIKGLMKDNEIFIASNENKNYQMIRISTSPSYFVNNDEERIIQFMEIIKKQFAMNDLKFLDIHIGYDDIDNEEFPFPVAVLDTNHHSGQKIDDVYPGIYEVIHDTQNEEAEIRKNILDINNAVKNFREKAKKRPLLKKLADQKCPITFAVMGICIFIYILSLFFSTKYSTTASVILLGADYKIFTLGLHEFYRLFTYAFAHGSFLHIVCNLMAFYSVSRIIERLLGKARYSIMLFTGIVFGSLLNGALSENGLLIGLSGGIYTLFTYFVLYFVSQGFINVRTFVPTIIINILLNFMPGVSWLCHLGGLMAGIMFYYIYKNNYINKYVVALTVFLMVVTGGKYIYENNLRPYYGQTDIEMISVYNHLGFKNHATNISNKLRTIYQGGK